MITDRWTTSQSASTFLPTLPPPPYFRTWAWPAWLPSTPVVGWGGKNTKKKRCQNSDSNKLLITSYMCGKHTLQQTLQLILQHARTHCNTHCKWACYYEAHVRQTHTATDTATDTATCTRTLQHTVQMSLLLWGSCAANTHCNRHCNWYCSIHKLTSRHEASCYCNHTATHCNQSATHYNTLQHTARHCKTLQRPATHYNTGDTDHRQHANSWQRRGGGLGSRPKKMWGERLGDGVEYHLMKPTPRR